MRTKTESGFTLVELLISITIIAILAVGLIVAVNPLEQINKSSDATDRTLVADLANAFDRHMAIKAAEGSTTILPGATLQTNANTGTVTSYLAGGTTIMESITDMIGSGALKSSWKTNATSKLSRVLVYGEFSSKSIYFCVKPSSTQYKNSAGQYPVSSAVPGTTALTNGALSTSTGIYTGTSGTTPAVVCSSAGTTNRDYCAYCTVVNYQ